MKKLMLGILLLTTTAYSRVGYTQAECAKKYGKHTLTTSSYQPSATKNYRAKYKGIDLVVSFHKGVCVRMLYENIENDKLAEKILTDYLGYFKLKKRSSDFTRKAVLNGEEVITYIYRVRSSGRLEVRDFYAFMKAEADEAKDF